MSTPVACATCPSTLRFARCRSVSDALLTPSYRLPPITAPVSFTVPFFALGVSFPFAARFSRALACFWS